MQVDVLIAGAGIVGLSAAYQIQQQFPDLHILVLDKEDKVAAHQTGHNSGVMHSGIYYKPGSYKAINCLQGYDMLKQFCDQYQIEYQLIGKLIVASGAEELDRLHAIYKNGLQNGLKNLSLLKSDQIKELEPNVKCLEAIRIPGSGIVDYKKVANKIAELIQLKNASVKTRKEIISIKTHHNYTQIACADGSEYRTAFFINCAGLQSDRITKMAGVETSYRIIPFKGNYFKLKQVKKDIVKHLIYPVPDPQFPFLGIHYTRLINGDQTLGPNAVLSFDREAYHRNELNIRDTYDTLSFSGFWKLIAAHWKTGMHEYRRNYSKNYFAYKASLMTPGIEASDLEISHSGIRAQLVDRDGKLVDDFVSIRKNKMIHVCNAPSPAATAGLSIGKQIAAWYQEMK